jgi:hypothetical protein
MYTHTYFKKLAYTFMGLSSLKSVGQAGWLAPQAGIDVAVLMQNIFSS